MSLDDSKNLDGTGIGDSQHISTSQELPRGVCFSSPLEIPGTSSGNITVKLLPSSSSSSSVQILTKKNTKSNKGKERTTQETTPQESLTTILAPFHLGSIKINTPEDVR
ncbi:hypothetical protein L873DRAFT_1794754 [Choiromyces venosus 120613-1]|uniref:Uncharacterized protein n=1 Tax=Choiromyces venosus 120613-1 TaxID=1336337 RepID=A0A3N4J0J5_9PEZI|nr:hypothetical protein L873DRAFT_1794754 [Choiromyces venosus 120613-1]